MVTDPVVTDPDAQIRAAESRAHAAYDLHPTTLVVPVETGHGVVPVRVMRFGVDVPGVNPIVMFHGIGSPAVLFAPLVRELSGRRVDVVDWPGHGLSGPVRLGSVPDLRTHAVTTLLGVLDGLGHDTVDVVAHSLGGQFTLYAALAHPERFGRIALLGDPGAAFEGVRPLPIMKLLATPLLGPLLLSIPMSDKAFARASVQTMGPGVVERLPAALVDAARAVSSRRANARSIAGYFAALLHRGRVRAGIPLVPRDLTPLSSPTLFLWGDEDPFLTPAAGTAFLEAIPDARLVVLTGGHTPWLEHPLEVAAAVCEHLGVPQANSAS